MILTGEKKFMKLSEIKPVNVGYFPEISIKNLYQEFSMRPEIMPYVPTTLPKGRQLDKTFFFTIVNSIFTDEL